MPLQADIRTLGGAGLRIANRAIAPLDWLARRRADATSAPIFVVGLPRSGTTLVYELIAQAYDVAFLTRVYSYLYGLPNTLTRLTTRFTHSPTPRFTSRYGRIPGFFAPAENGVLWNRWFTSGQRLGHYVPPGCMEERDRKAVAKLVQSMTAIADRPFLFKNVYFTISLQAVLEAIPEATFVVVRRPLETVCASVYRIRSERDGWWSIRPPFYADVADKDVVEQIAFQCVRTTQLLDREIRMIPRDRCFVADYETVCAAPREFIDCLGTVYAGSLERRPQSEIPESFKASASTEPPPAVYSMLASKISELEQDEEAYLARVDAHAGERAAVLSSQQT